MERVTYDSETDVLYVRLHDGDSAKQVLLDDARIIDRSADGVVLGIEFLGASDGVDLTDVPFAPTVQQPIEESGLGLEVFA
ncbi:MAG: DUF2283 domain-containing protein [Dehalococcoidia bacterium]|nr:DUF2283 domain-containing protein [Dehalococcoidia bacterium]